MGRVGGLRVSSGCMRGQDPFKQSCPAEKQQSQKEGKEFWAGFKRMIKAQAMVLEWADLETRGTAGDIESDTRGEPEDRNRGRWWLVNKAQGRGSCVHACGYGKPRFKGSVPPEI